MKTPLPQEIMVGEHTLKAVIHTPGLAEYENKDTRDILCVKAARLGTQILWSVYIDPDMDEIVTAAGSASYNLEEAWRAELRAYQKRVDAHVQALKRLNKAGVV